MTTSAPAPDTSSKAASALCSLWQWVRAEAEHFDGAIPDDFIVELVEDAMSAAKTTSERVAKLRADRDALGLKRLELYAHPDDWPAIKACAEKLQARRQRKGKREAG
jgi:hypothetical protein